MTISLAEQVRGGPGGGSNDQAPREGPGLSRGRTPSPPQRRAHFDFGFNRHMLNFCKVFFILNYLTWKVRDGENKTFFSTFCFQIDMKRQSKIFNVLEDFVSMQFRFAYLFSFLYLSV